MYPKPYETHGDLFPINSLWTFQLDVTLQAGTTMIITGGKLMRKSWNIPQFRLIR